MSEAVQIGGCILILFAMFLALICILKQSEKAEMYGDVKAVNEMLVDFFKWIALLIALAIW